MKGRRLREGILLELDYTNVLETAVHGQGIPRIAFDKAAESSKHVVDDIQRAHTSGTLAFGDLPSDEKALKVVTDFAASHSYPNVLLLGPSVLRRSMRLSAVRIPGSV